MLEYGLRVTATTYQLDGPRSFAVRGGPSGPLRRRLCVHQSLMIRASAITMKLTFGDLVVQVCRYVDRRVWTVLLACRRQRDRSIDQGIALDCGVGGEKYT
jgi:hypothetical protein